MTSFTNWKAPVRPDGADGEFEITPATGLDDPRASKGGQALMELVHNRTGGKRMLQRSDFSPKDIKDLLPNIILFEVVYDQDGTVKDGIIRLIGSALSSFYGNFTGRSVLDHSASTGKRFLMSAHSIITSELPSLGTADEAVSEMPFYKVKTCLVPIADKAGKIIQIMGHIQLYTEAGEAYSGAL